MKLNAILLFGVASGPLFAGVVSMQASSSFPFAAPGVTSCSQSGSGPISCFINATFSDPTGRHGAHADGTVASAFGSISGGLFTSLDQGAILSSYSSSFDDFVTVSGALGSGTLITHYQLISTDEQTRANGQAVSPIYFFLQGTASSSHTPALPQLDSSLTATLTESFDVVSPITFGEPIRLAAQTSASHNFQFASQVSNLNTTSSAQITGYTVLDSLGATVAGAAVQLSSIPEPGTVWSGIVAAVLLALRHRRHG